MYLPTLLASVLIALVVLTGMQGIFAYTKVSISQQASRYVTLGLDRANSLMLTTYGAAIQSGEKLEAIPQTSPAPLCAPSGSGGGANAPCPYNLSVAVDLEGSSAAGVTAPNNSENSMNLNASVAEQRIAVALTATITAPDGTVLAKKQRSETIRTFGGAPYVAVIGSSDGAPEVEAEGDNSGCAGNAGCGDNTEVKAFQQCVIPVSASDPSYAGYVSECVSAGFVPTAGGAYVKPVDQYGDAAWTNGNGGAQPWGK